MSYPLLSLSLIFDEQSGISRCDEPVTAEIPLPKDIASDPVNLDDYVMLFEKN